MISALVSGENNLKALKNIKLSKLSITAGSCRILAESGLATQLSSIEFRQCSFEFGALKQLASKDWNLEVLRMTACSFWDARIIDEDLEYSEDSVDSEVAEYAGDRRTYYEIYMAKLFSCCRLLKNFELDCQHIKCSEQGLWIDISDLRELMNVKHPVLEEFIYENCDFGSAVGDLVAEKAAGNWPALRVLNLDGSHLDNDGFLYISDANLPNLEELSMDYPSTQDCRGISCDEAIWALRDALETSWPRLKKLQVDNGCLYGEKCAVLLGGFIPFENLQVINPNDELQSPQTLSAFTKAAEEGLLPAYRQLKLMLLGDENSDVIGKILAAPWSSLEVLELRTANGRDFPAHEALLKVAISEGSYPSLKKLLLYDFSFDFCF